VIGVEMGQHDERNSIDVEVVEAAIDKPRIGTCVDDDRRTRRDPDSHRVALADVAHREQPVTRRPADPPPRLDDPSRVTAASAALASGRSRTSAPTRPRPRTGM
jgi:hypothetical protein